MLVVSGCTPHVTLPKTKIAPEHRPLEKEILIGNHHFQGFVEGFWNRSSSAVFRKSLALRQMGRDFLEYQVDHCGNFPCKCWWCCTRWGPEPIVINGVN